MTRFPFYFWIIITVIIIVLVITIIVHSDISIKIDQTGCQDLVTKQIKVFLSV